MLQIAILNDLLIALRYLFFAYYKMDKKLIEEFDRKQKSSKRKKLKSQAASSSNKVDKSKTKEPEVVVPSTSYRDRAKERREGINKDFELDPDDLLITGSIIDNAASGEDKPLTEEERRLQQIEESKYLGGDVEHTHLVKGLDFALLEKVKNEQKLAKNLGAEDGDAEMDLLNDSDDDMEAILAASSSGATGSRIVELEEFKKGKSSKFVPCRTALARRILNVLDEEWPKKSELFAPGRMSYVLSLEEPTLTTVIRSRVDAPSSSNEETLALDQLINILSNMRQNSGLDKLHEVNETRDTPYTRFRA